VKKLFFTLLILSFVLGITPGTTAAHPVLQGLAGEQDVVVQADDWLSRLADKFYGNILAFPAIVEATNQAATADDSYAAIDNPDVIELGQKLCIPASGDAEAFLSESGASEATAGLQLDEITIATAGIAANVSTLDPLFDSVVKETIVNMFDVLVKIEREEVGGQRVFNLSDKGIATSWQPVDDRTWEIKIRSGVTFHDGSPLTAEDVVFSINYILDPTQEVPLASQLTGITGAEFVDDETFLLKTETPLASAISKLARVFVVPSDHYEAVGAEAFSENPIGSGPYKFVEWVKDDHITLEANADYWGGAPAVSRAVFRHVPEDATRAAAIKSGEANIVNNIPPALYADLVADANVSAFIFNGMQHILFGLDGQKPPFDDPRVRQAVMYAVNREEIINSLFQGLFARPITGLVAEGLLGYDPALEQVYSYNPDKARELLAEAGYADGFSTQLLYSPGRYAQGTETVQVIIANLAEVGINVEPMTAEGAQRLQMIREGTVPGIFSTSCLNETGDPSGCLDLWASKDQGRGWYWPDFNLDTEIAQQNATFDETERAELVQEINRQLTDMAPFIWMHHENIGWAVTKGIQFEPTWEGYTDLRNLSLR